ncbi:MAG: flagellar biosynthetic protein FliO [Clostridiaceae bacterium]|nr:flagellar biosynthetic protein FliO [Clostridiaceae bacterium]
MNWIPRLYASADAAGTYDGGESAQMLLLPLLGVALVIFLAYIFTKWLAGKYSGNAAGRYVKVIERLSVGKDRELVLIELNGRAHLLGITGQGVTTICSFEAGELPPRASPHATGFREALETALGRDRRLKHPFGSDGDGESKQS